jgi:fatty acid CoA ligase FadD21
MSPPSILSMLHGRASLRPHDVAFIFTNYEDDWEGVPESLTWSQLSRRTLNVARELDLYGSVGDRAVILVPQSLDYIAAFLGSMQAGLIAVPLPLPHRGSRDERVSAVLADTSPSVVLTTSMAEQAFGQLICRARRICSTAQVQPDCQPG